MTLADDVRRGLATRPKRIPSVHFYDAEGSRIFEEITRLPEYYLTETERGIFRAHAADILAAAGWPPCLVELGAGTADKTRVLIEALLARTGHAEYVPIDVSRDALDAAVATLAREHPELVVRSVVARNRPGLRSLGAMNGARLVLFIGSSIGNFEPEDAIDFLSDVRAELRPQDRVLLGTDMMKDPAVLEPAYFDSQGVTTRFNLNLLRRINRELDADFDLDAFRHEARFNENAHRMESHLVSTRPQVVRVRALGLEARFEEGESIHVENSHKYTDEDVTDLTKRAGLEVVESWFDARRWFGVHLLRGVEP